MPKMFVHLRDRYLCTPRSQHEVSYELRTYVRCIYTCCCVILNRISSLKRQRRWNLFVRPSKWPLKSTHPNENWRLSEARDMNGNFYNSSRLTNLLISSMNDNCNLTSAVDGRSIDLARSRSFWIDRDGQFCRHTTDHRPYSNGFTSG